MSDEIPTCELDHLLPQPGAQPLAPVLDPLPDERLEGGDVDGLATQGLAAEHVQQRQLRGNGLAYAVWEAEEEDGSMGSSTAG